MKPRREVLALVGAAVVLAGAGYWYASGDETTPVNSVVQNEPRKTRDEPPPTNGNRSQREQTDTGDEVAPATPKRNTVKEIGRPNNVRGTDRKGSPKKKETPAV